MSENRCLSLKDFFILYFNTILKQHNL